MTIIDAIRLLQERKQLRQVVFVCSIRCGANRLQQVRNALVSKYVQATDYRRFIPDVISTNHLYIPLKEFLDASEVGDAVEQIDRTFELFNYMIAFNVYADIVVSKHECIYDKNTEILYIYHTKELATTYAKQSENSI